MATGFRVYPFLGRVPGDVAWRPQPRRGGPHSSLQRSTTSPTPSLAERYPFTSSHFPEPLQVDGILIEGHVLWGMTLRLLDGLVPRLLAGEWAV